MRNRPIWKWLLTIEDPIRRRQALQNYTRYKHRHNMVNGETTVNSLARAVDTGMIWDETPEGSDYWSIYHESLH